ncbi:DUF6134 family protein [Candidatus Pelagibacter sp.]|uniref:DUF6134 family protein n=1 Tax=Candidatus Pelagibacter sp. TaxID=2024849 RepID=UPI003F83D543
MKKFSIILLIVFFSSISFAHIGHYNKFNKIEMEILRNDEVIGYNNYFFERDGEKTRVKNQYKFEVKLLSATIFKVEGYGEEIYLKDNLISFQSKTLQNKKEKFVNLKLDKNNKKFDIKGSSYSGEASEKNIIGNWWSHKILQAESQISPISGSIKEQIVTFIGKENILINGKQYETDHFKLTSKDMSLPEDKKLNFDIWLDKKTSVIVKVTYKRIGDWEYRLKNLE